MPADLDNLDQKTVRWEKRRIDVKRADARMRVRRADDNAMKRVRRSQIGDVAPAPLHEARVFYTVDAAPQQWFGHVRLYGTGWLPWQ